MTDNKLQHEEGLFDHVPSSRYPSFIDLIDSKAFCIHAKGLTEDEVHVALRVFLRSFRINSIVIRRSGGI